MRQAIFTSKEPLNDNQLISIAPSIYAPAPHESRSNRYEFIPTITVLNELRKEGFMPYSVAQAKSRIPGKTEFTKHMIRFRKAGFETGEEIPEVVMINSHDGTSSYKMFSGVFRMVCLNGLIAGDVEQDFKVNHKGGDVLTEVVESAYEITDGFLKVREEIKEMKAIELKKDEQTAFAEAAITLKYDEGKAPINPEKLLSQHRTADTENNLWTTLNVVQENLIRGGQTGYIHNNGNTKRVKTRPVNSIDGNVKINKALWILANRMAEIKA